MDAQCTEFMLLMALQAEDNIAAEDDADSALLSIAAVLVGTENAWQTRLNRIEVKPAAFRDDRGRD